MDLKRFENTAHQSYWSVHIEAWRQSGVSRTRYCRDHGLNRHTFGSWVIYLMGRDEARKHEEYQAYVAAHPDQAGQPGLPPARD